MSNTKMKILSLCRLSVLCTLTVLGCSSTQQIRNTYNYDEFEDTVPLTFSAPNFSAIHMPPLGTALAFVLVYEKSTFCANKRQKPLAELYMSKKTRTAVTRLPVTDIVIWTGFHNEGYDGSGNSCKRHFAFEVKRGFEYEITVTESRPLVTSCYFSVKEKNAEGDYSPSIDMIASEKKFFALIEDTSNICEEVAQASDPQANASLGDHRSRG